MVPPFDRLSFNHKYIYPRIFSWTGDITCFTEYKTSDFKSATRWIMYNEDLKVAAFVLPATCRPEGAKAAQKAGTIIYLEPNETKTFHVKTGLK